MTTPDEVTSARQGMDEPDPTTGLTPREREAIVESWNMIPKSGMRDAGLDIFFRFFSAHPEYQQLFPTFRNIPLETINSDPKLRNKLAAHALNVMYAITAVVDTLDEPDVLVALLEKVGSNHNRRNIPKKAFGDLKHILVQSLKLHLGTRFTPEMEAAWDKALGVVMSVVQQQITGSPK